MKKLIPLITSLLFLGNIIYAQESRLIWQKCYGGKKNEGINDMVKTSDGGYILTGYTQEGDTTKNQKGDNVWILKLKKDGSIDWQKYYGGSKNDWGNSIKQTSDRGYIVACYSESNDGDFSKGKILKLTPKGNVEWQSYGPSHTIIQTLDGGYIVNGSDGSSASAVKIDSNGKFEWDKTYSDYPSYGGDVRGVYGYSVLQLPDSNYVFASSTSEWITDTVYHHDYGKLTYHITKTDNKGNDIWTKDLDGNQWFDIMRNVKLIKTSDGGYALGYNYDYSVTISKLDSNGNEKWYYEDNTMYDDGASTLFETKDSGFILTGGLSYSPANDHIYRLDKLGNLQWEKKYGGTSKNGYTYDGTALLDDDGSFLIAATTNDNNGNITGNHGGSDAWLFRLKGNINIILPNTISGEVSQSNGKALANSKVYIAKYDTANSKVIKLDSAITDSSGYYSISTFDSLCNLYVVPDASFSKEATTYFDSSLTIQGAQTIVLIKETDTVINFSTVLKMNTVKGKVTQSNGKALVNSKVCLAKLDTVNSKIIKLLDVVNSDSAGNYSLASYRDTVGLYVLPDSIYKKEINTFYKLSSNIRGAQLILFNKKYDTTINFSSIGITQTVITKQSNNSKEMKVSPNPTKDQLTVAFEKPFSGSYEVRVYNIYGQLITAQSGSKNDLYMLLDFSAQPKGVYLLQCISKEAIVCRRVVVE